MGKRGLLAGAFLAMAVGLGIADDGDVQNPPFNGSLTCKVSPKNLPQAGHVRFDGDFANYPTGCVTAAMLDLYMVDKSTNKRTGTSVQTVVVQYKQPYSGTDTIGGEYSGLAKGEIVQAEVNLTGALPFGAPGTKVSVNYSVP